MQNNRNLIVVTGAGGFIGGSLISALRANGSTSIRAVDIKPFDAWYQRFGDVENLSLDLNLKESCEVAAKAPAKFIILLRTWAAWASLRTIKPFACYRS